VLPASAAVFATACRAGATSQVVAPLPNTLAGFNMNVECSATAPSEAAATITVYQLTSTATQGTVATPSYVERQMTVTIAQ
jgi:MSHA biogenesis protein MshP